MENTTTYAARMRFLDASDVDDGVVDFDGLAVRGTDGETIGSVDGFIVDAESRRVNHVVVDSGGWFTSQRFLLPIGHATVASDRKSLQLDVTREALRRLPEYDEDRFRAFSDDELRAFERDTVVTCCPDEPLEDVSVSSWGYDTRRHYAQPDWWAGATYQPERLRQLARSQRMDASRSASQAIARGPGERPHEANPGAALPRGEASSPHVDGRAQPGDVLGIETGGERTSIGDTRDDEDQRRDAAARAGRSD